MVKIYALVEGNLILYVGKTTTSLKRREKYHRAKSNTSHSRYIPEHCEWEIVEIGEYPDDEEVLWEQFWYDTLDPLYNKCRPGQTTAEYKQTEKVKKSQAEYSRKYRQTENGKKSYAESNRIYQQSEKGKKGQAEASRRYRLKMKALAVQQLAE
jgi:hypothetical protein